MKRSLFLLALTAWQMGCASGDDEPEEPAWQVVFEGMEPALMSISGTAADDVWTVGADPQDGDGAIALHYDGKRWHRQPTGVEADLWWVHVLASDSVWMSGSQGTILHFDGDEVEVMDTPSDGSIVYGIWGLAQDDLWAVGGVPEASPGFVWHFDGDTWSDMSDQLPQGSDGPALFKIFGHERDDIWIVGDQGTAIHWDGERFEDAETGTDQQLFTVHGPPSGKPPYVAVGGAGKPVILERSGTEWHNVAPKDGPPMLFGVCMKDADLGYAVGWEGSILRRKDGAWKLLDTGVELFGELHSVWIDPEDGVWAVGGDLLGQFPVDGMLVHQGNEVSDEMD